jgi:hypothetical protein
MSIVIKPLVIVLLTVVAAGCAGGPRGSLQPIPEHAAQASAVRGTDAAARAIPEEQEIEIISEVVRTFYRPTMGQARWIDARPLANERTTAADSLAKPEEDWADAIVAAAGLRRVCTADADEACRGRPGGTLRFSKPYATGPESAVVFAQYSPVAGGPGGSEMEFRMVRRERAWHIDSKQTVPLSR